MRNPKRDPGVVSTCVVHQGSADPMYVMMRWQKHGGTEVDLIWNVSNEIGETANCKLCKSHQFCDFFGINFEQLYRVNTRFRIKFAGCKRGEVCRLQTCSLQAANDLFQMRWGGVQTSGCHHAFCWSSLRSNNFFSLLVGRTGKNSGHEMCRITRAFRKT